MKPKKLVILKGEGSNQHTLIGDVKAGETEDFMKLEVKDTTLFHETPTGQFAEHNTLVIPDGKLVMGKQVQYSPWSGEVTRVID